MTFRDWAKDLFNMFNMDNKTAEEYWQAAFDEGVKWALKQDANTLNKLQLTLEESDEQAILATASVNESQE